MQIERVCLYCGKSFNILESRLKFGKGKFCSTECQYKGQFQKHHVVVNCAVCGKEMERFPSHVKSEHQFCSARCHYDGRALGLVKPSNWKGGISFEPYCPKFNDDLKKRVREFFDNKCILCGNPKELNGKNLHVHHVEYNKQACCDGLPVHFAALCIHCHMKTNFDRTRWENIMHIIIDEIYDGRSYFTKEEFAIIRGQKPMSPASN